MGLDRGGGIALSGAAPDNRLRPTVAHLLRSVREVYGAGAAAVQLAGMGKDGAEELPRRRQCGAVTFAQDEESAVVFGMPGEAVKLSAATYVLAPQEISRVLRDILAVGKE